ncbi:guanine deaminase [Oceaniovalibus sp. ACAM 378]|uniref:guanine deaminase n=1 Tax=Oceaniovalibus sp. ACAM 378 TaxID=2599923 RepID=UPI0011DAF825|nr:guanine deaminase [Oceaniovalibus sp. ACAM 378]TYB84863.1 guanine deaminase [Oceaniovalibus sp. ACAM 378]
MTNKTLITGQLLTFHANPFSEAPQDAVRHERQGAILVEGGIIRATGPAEILRAAHPQARVADMGAALLLPGFVDAHAHYPQTEIIASWGKRLIDWLNTYTFPAEMEFGDPAHAARIAERYFDLTLSHGTTTVCSFATSHPGSVDAFFAEAQKRGLRAVTGKTCMDRNAPDGLMDTAQSAYDDSKALLERWHGVDRLEYAITPRFTPTSSRAQLHALGALWTEFPDCLMQTHLSEQIDEIAWVRDLHPQARDYLDTYEQADLLGPKAVFGHSIHLEPREIDRIAEAGAGLVHCPTSNTFIGSGLFDMGLARRLTVGLATDTGGGSSFSMLRTMAAAYEIGQLRGNPLHPAQLLWLATEGSARAMHMVDRIGTLEVGSEADIIALDLGSTPAIAQRAARADDIWEQVFPTIMMGDDRAIAGVWTGGNRC